MDESDAKKPAAFGLSKNVISMGTVSFLNDLSSDMIFPFIPAFVTTVLGGSAAFVGVIEGVADATQSIVKIFSGRFSDKWNKRKPFVVFGYSLSALSKPLLALAGTPWHVLGVRFLDRFGKGTRDAPRDALISFSTEHKTIGRAFGFHRGADTLGAAIGPLIAVLILPLIGNNLRTLFLLSFIASAVAVFILSLSVKEVARDRKIESPTIAPPAGFRFSDLGAPFLVFLISATIFNLGRISEAFFLLRAQDIGIALMFLPLVYVVYSCRDSCGPHRPPKYVHDRHGHFFRVSSSFFCVSERSYDLASCRALWAL